MQDVADRIVEDESEMNAEEVVDRERERRRSFLIGRQQGIGSSDLLGTSDYPKILDGGALEVYHSKTRPITDEDVDAGAQRIDLMRGNLLEPLAVALYWKVTGREGKRERGQRFHTGYPGAMTSADGTIFADPERPEWQQGTGGLEIKAPRASVMQALVEHGTREGIIMQLQHSLAVRRLAWGSFGFFNLEHQAGPIVPVDVAADPVIGTFLLEICARFWIEHVVPRVPPDPIEWAKLLDKAPPVRETSGKLVVLERAGDAPAEPMVRRLMEVSKVAGELKASKDQLQAALDDWLKVHYPDHAKFQLPGVGKVTRVTSSRKTLQEDLLKGAKPIDRDAFVRWMRVNGPDVKFDSELEALADQLALDLDRFKKQGDQFSYLLLTAARGEA